MPTFRLLHGQHIGPDFDQEPHPETKRRPSKTVRAGELVYDEVDLAAKHGADKFQRVADDDGPIRKQQRAAKEAQAKMKSATKGEPRKGEDTAASVDEQAVNKAAEESAVKALQATDADNPAGRSDPTSEESIAKATKEQTREATSPREPVRGTKPDVEHPTPKGAKAEDHPTPKAGSHPTLDRTGHGHGHSSHGHKK